MARYNEILVGRFARFAQKMFGTKGAVPTAQLAGDVQLNMSFFSGAEHRFLENWERFGTGFLVPASAAQSSNARLRNPVGSNLVAVIEKIQLAVGVADPNLLVRFGVGAADLASAVSGIARFDARGRPSPTLVPSFTNAGAAVGQVWLRGNFAVNVPQDLIITDIHELPILPGDALDIGTTAVNVAMNVSLIWRERFLEEPERQ